MKRRRRISPTTFKRSIVVFNADPGIHGINRYYIDMVGLLLLHTTREHTSRKRNLSTIHFQTKWHILKSVQDLKCHVKIVFKTKSTLIQNMSWPIPICMYRIQRHLFKLCRLWSMKWMAAESDLFNSSQLYQSVNTICVPIIMCTQLFHSLTK